MLHLNAHCGFRRRRGEDSKCLPFQDGHAQGHSFAPALGWRQQKRVVDYVVQGRQAAQTKATIRAGKTSQADLELLGPLSCWGGLLALELLARLLGPLLKFVLQLLLLFLELLGVGRWTVIGLGEIRERDHEADGLA